MNSGDSEVSTVKGDAEPGARYHPNISREPLEPLQSPDPDEIITIETDELSGVCPVEYQDGNEVRDFYKLTLIFTPNVEEELSVELKSLKLYLEQFQNVPISHEQVASTIYAHIKGLIDPAELYVRVEPNIRGGITTMVELGEKPERKQEEISHKDR